MSIDRFYREGIFWEIEAKFIDIFFFDILYLEYILMYQLFSFHTIFHAIGWGYIQPDLSMWYLLFSESWIEKTKKSPNMELILFECAHTPSLMEAEVSQEIFERKESIHTSHNIYFLTENNKNSPEYSGEFLLKYWIDDLPLEYELDFLESSISTDIYTSSRFFGEYFFIRIYYLSLSISDEYPFVIASHLLSFGWVDETIDEVESEKSPFGFLSIFREIRIFFHGSFFETFERLVELYREIDRDSFIEEFVIYSISPPEKPISELMLTHAEHESTYDKCLRSTIEYHYMSFFHSGDHLTLYTIEKISRLEK